MSLGLDEADGQPELFRQSRAEPSGLTLTSQDASVVKAMLKRGDRQHDIAAWFGVNGGRIAEISMGRKHPDVKAATGKLPPSGPYPGARHAFAALEALAKARMALNAAARTIRNSGYLSPE
jgi:hypothetical protein